MIPQKFSKKELSERLLRALDALEESMSELAIVSDEIVVSCLDEEDSEKKSSYKDTHRY